jgi:hypothetical protein
MQVAQYLLFFVSKVTDKVYKFYTRTTMKKSGSIAALLKC